jgi:MFS transporter, DHA2 family, multidrug resistance protein
VVIPLSTVLLEWIDARALLGFGIGILVYSFHLNAHLPLDADFSDVTFALMLRSAGSSLLYVPVTLAAFLHMGERDRASGVGLFNLMRELGASIGTALLVHFVSERQVTHASVLVDHAVSVGAVAGGGASSAVGAAGAVSVDAFEHAVRRHAALGAFNDAFAVLAWVTALTVPCLLLLGGKKEREPAKA